jgi:uncharacterized protein (DUF1800 family)
MGETAKTTKSWSQLGSARRHGGWRNAWSRDGGRPPGREAAGHDLAPPLERAEAGGAAVEADDSIPPAPLFALPAPEELLEEWPPRPNGHGARDGDEPDSDEAAQRRRRRQVLAGAGGATAGALVLWVAKGTPPLGADGVTPPPPNTGPRDAASQPSEAAAYGSRDESFAAGGPEAELPADAIMVFATASEAAANTEVTTPTILALDRPALHLLRRVTFGPTQALVDEVEAKGIDAWIAEQTNPMAIQDDVADVVWGLFPMASMNAEQIYGAQPRSEWHAMHAYGQATVGRQIWSQRQLYEVMVDFWGDHLHVTIPSDTVWDVGNSYYNDVIRGHALGSFSDMLLAAGRHPGMLRYLNNNKSMKESVNENFGRELLELHTVGVGSGYTEDDVRNSAYILTGRTVAGEGDMMMGGEGQFVYDPQMHWTGAVRVLDFQHANPSAEGGLEVGDEYLRYLASHPATAQTIARKLAVRFVSDNPPQSLVDRLATTYLDNGTAIKPVLDIMFRSREFWASVGAKTRRPLENFVATARVLDVQPGGNSVEAVEGLYWATGDLGHTPLAWRSPNGYPDVQAAWRSASGMLATWNRHRAMVGGWYDGLTFQEPAALVGGRPSATAGEYLDSMCERLCFQRFRPEHRDVLLLFLEAPADAATAQTELESRAGPLAALVLDSPYFSLR